MSNIRPLSARRRVAIALALLAGAIAACDRASTAPELRRVAPHPAAIEGDTLSCRFGWTVIAGRYVCNDPT